ncbi:MAG TPA: hypothetical protein VEW69_01420 [Alphaproteobacteria bacterium]|nr:hypothetical protein [Alphaproteobacteria bacterium]
MRSDRVEISWDKNKSKWVVRIQAGEEVIRRYSNLAQNADEQSLRQEALKTLQDEGYEPEATISVQRAAS